MLDLHVRRLPVLLFWIGLTACTTISRVTDLAEYTFTKGEKSATLIAIPYEIELAKASFAPDAQCELTLKNVTSGEDFVATFRPGKGVLLTEAPLGVYKARTFSCRRALKWQLQKFLAEEVTLVANRVNDLGLLSLRLDETEQLSVRYEDRKKEGEALARVFAKLPTEWKSKVASPYTRKLLTEAMAAPEGPEAPYRLDMKAEVFAGANAQESEDVTLPLQKALRLCDEAERQRSPMGLGRLAWQAQYEAHKLTELKKSINDHAFSDDFESCLDQAFGQFAPTLAAKIVFSFRY